MAGGSISQAAINQVKAAWAASPTPATTGSTGGSYAVPSGYSYTWIPAGSTTGKSVTQEQAQAIVNAYSGSTAPALSTSTPTPVPAAPPKTTTTMYWKDGTSYEVPNDTVELYKGQGYSTSAPSKTTGTSIYQGQSVSTAPKLTSTSMMTAPAGEANTTEVYWATGVKNVISNPLLSKFIEAGWSVLKPQEQQIKLEYKTNELPVETLRNQAVRDLYVPAIQENAKSVAWNYGDTAKADSNYIRTALIAAKPNISDYELTQITQNFLNQGLTVLQAYNQAQGYVGKSSLWGRPVPPSQAIPPSNKYYLEAKKYSDIKLPTVYERPSLPSEKATTVSQIMERNKLIRRGLTGNDAIYVYGSPQTGSFYYVPGKMTEQDLKDLQALQNMGATFQYRLSIPNK